MVHNAMTGIYEGFNTSKCYSIFDMLIERCMCFVTTCKHTIIITRTIGFTRVGYITIGIERKKNNVTKTITNDKNEISN